MDTVVILGNFDGVHLGHQTLIKSAISYAKAHNLKTLVYTFSSLPTNKKYIMTVSERVEKIKKLGVDDVYIDNFYNIKNYTSTEFVNEILKDKLKAKVIFCGFDYTFGYNKEGSVENLKKLIDTVVIDKVTLDNDEKISSTKIRSLIENGDFETANRLLGAPFVINGNIIHGKALGRTIGFPTANIKPNALKILPLFGVYGVKVLIEGDEKIYSGIMNIGKNPTVNSKDNITIETNILDFNKDIYGKNIKIFVLENLRKEKKFESLDKLKEQISIDVEKWRKIENDKYKTI